MATENADDVRQNEPVEHAGRPGEVAERTERTERTERRPARDRFESEAKEENDRRGDIRQHLKAAFKEHAKNPREPRERRPRKEDTPATPEPDSAAQDAAQLDSAPSDGKTLPKTDDGQETPTAEASQQTQDPVPPAPAALSRDLKALWPKLDPAVRNEFARLEAEGAKGVEKLKERYKSYDDALSPLRDELKSVGRTEAEGIRMLADWRRALSGPQKVQAFAALAKLEGIDLSQLVPKPSPTTSQPTPSAPVQAEPNPNDPATLLRPFLDPLTQKLTSLETELQRRDRLEAERQTQSVQRDIQAFSKGKPHIERVRVRMGILLGNGQVTGDTPQEAFDRAYEQACRSDPEVFAEMQQEEQAKREAEQLAASQAAAKKAADAEAERKRKQAEEVEKARRASGGPRGSSPSGMLTTNKTKGQSVGESLRAAVKEVRAAI